MVARGSNYEEHRVDAAIERAIPFLPEGFLPRHEHSARCFGVLKHILYPDEYTIIEAKQSMLKSPAPMRLVATNRRVIMVRPSFWSLWAGRNILFPTKYESMPYENIVNIALYTGIVFSTLSIRLNSVADGGVGDLGGLKKNDARAMFAFLEKMAEFLRAPSRDSAVAPSEWLPRHIDMVTTRKLAQHRSATIIWLGTEPVEYVSESMKVNKDAIIQMNAAAVMHLDAESAKGLEHCIFVCYEDSLAEFASRQLKEKLGLDSYVLEGGLSRGSGYQYDSIEQL